MNDVFGTSIYTDSTSHLNYWDQQFSVVFNPDSAYQDDNESFLLLKQIGTEECFRTYYYCCSIYKRNF